MDAVARATEALRKSEATLRALVSEASAAGDYASVVRIASWAKIISNLGSSTKQRTTRSGLSSKTKAVRRVEKAHNGYPRFYRQGDTVVRIAWSKRQKAEYQHKAPYSVLLALADAMVEVGDDGRIFSTDDFLPIEADGAAVPAYQAYLGIALFKHVGLIDQHGRQGYSIPRLTKFKDAVVAIWKKLPPNRAEGA